MINRQHPDFLEMLNFIQRIFLLSKHYEQMILKPLMPMRPPKNSVVAPSIATAEVILL